MIRDGDKVLVQDKVKKEGWEGLTFPGGKVEPFESFHDAVIREVREETGLMLTSVEFCGILQWVYDSGERDAVCLYRSDSFTGELTEDCEEGPVDWMEWEAFLAAKDDHAEFMEAYLRVLLDPMVSEAFCRYSPGAENVFLFYGE